MKNIPHTRVGLSQVSEHDALQLSRAHFFGDVCSLLSLLPEHRHRPVEIVATELFPAFRHDHVKLLYNEFSQPVCYVSWALVDNETESRWLKFGRVELHISEWNEGDNLWIIDFACDPKFLGQALTNLIQMIPKEFEEFKVAQRRPSRIVFRSFPLDCLREAAT
jgi:hemolysin-activating ACP:hemolysin acyltransferase